MCVCVTFTVDPALSLPKTHVAIALAQASNRIQPSLAPMIPLQQSLVI